MAREDSFDSTRAEIFEALGHPVRVKILYSLEGGAMGFSALKKETDIESSGHLQFHLGKLHHMVRTNAEGSYALTDDGKEALRVLKLTGSSGPVSVKAASRSLGNWTKTVIAVFLISLIVLGAFAAYQQQQITLAQGQLTSKDQQIALYVNQAHPFTSGQAASLVLGHEDFVGGFPDVSAPSQVEMNGPSQVLFDSRGNLWIVDSWNNRVLEFKPPFSNGMKATLVIGQKDFTSSISSTAGDRFGAGRDTAGQIGPAGGAFDSSGNLWIADSVNNRIVEFEPPFATGMSASIVLGQKNLTAGPSALETGQGNILLPKPSRSTMNYPTNPVFDAEGNLWVVDSYNNRVLEFRPPFTDGMNASIVLGQASFEANLPLLSQSGLHCWRGNLAIDSSGNIWVADWLNNRILEFKPPFHSGMNASFVLGQPNYSTIGASSSLGGSASIAGSASPIGEVWATSAIVAFDSAGNLWTTFSGRILEFTPPFSSSMEPTLEIGQPDFRSFAWLSGPSGLVNPGIPEFDSSGNLWVPDSGNNRVLEFAAGVPASNGGASNQSAPLIGQLVLTAIGASITAVIIMSVVLLRRSRKAENGRPPTQANSAPGIARNHRPHTLGPWKSHEVPSGLFQ